MSLRGKYFLFWGLTIGLFFGVLGDLLANHLLEILKGLVAKNLWLTVNVMIFLIDLFAMLTMIVWTVSRMRSIRSHHESLETLLKLLQERRSGLRDRGFGIDWDSSPRTRVGTKDKI